MIEDSSIILENVSLDFPVNRNNHSFIKEIFTGRKKELKRAKFYTAVDSVNIEIKKGEVFGIVGPNGAGKSTLLRIMAGIYAPDNGTVTVKGKVTLLAGLGAGFQRNLTGRENIQLSGSVYGISKQKLHDLIPSIIIFSGISEFIDQPLRTYSSGMRARLAFAIACHLSPDIILIDEVFSVGDSAFKEKSKNKIMEMVKGNETVVVVSHNASILREVCDRVICMNKGKIDIMSDDINSVIDRYRELSQQ